MKDTVEFRLALAEGLYALEKKRSDLFAIYETQKQKTKENERKWSRLIPDFPKPRKFDF